MSSTALVPVEEYLRRTGKPNCEYVDGALYPKAIPTTLHAWVQSLLVLLLAKQGQLVLSELTLRVNPTTFLIPDVTVVASLQFPYPEDPALLCVEILSPEDRVGALLAKCEQYHAWGVPHCWVIDPVKQVGWEYHASSDPVRVDSMRALTAGPISAPIESLFPNQLS